MNMDGMAWFGFWVLLAVIVWADHLENMAHMVRP